MVLPGRPHSFWARTWEDLIPIRFISMKKLLVLLIIAWLCEITSGGLYLVSGHYDSSAGKLICQFCFSILPALVFLGLGRSSSLRSLGLLSVSLAILVVISIQLGGITWFPGLIKDMEFASMASLSRVFWGSALLAALYFATSLIAAWLGRFARR
jgi:hypothetical protein